MRRYEIMFILSSKLDDPKVKTLQKKVEDKILTNNEGKIIKKEEWGLKEFAYEIKKEKQGYYFVYYVETTTDGINELNRLYRITADLVRIMIIAVDDKWSYETNENVINKIPQKRTRKPYPTKKKPYVKREDGEIKEDNEEKKENKENKGE